MAPLQTDMSVVVTANQTSVLDLATAAAAQKLDASATGVVSLASGTGANQADQSWSDERTLTTGANEDLDLTGTALQNAFGVNIAFARVKVILIVSDSTNT